MSNLKTIVVYILFTKTDKQGTKVLLINEEEAK